MLDWVIETADRPKYIDTWSKGPRLSWLGLVDERINSAVPWWLAGGISAEWVPTLLNAAKPFGLDASSRLERSPGIKDLGLVEELVEALRACSAKRR